MLKIFGVEVSIFYLIAEITLVVHVSLIMIFVFTLIGKFATALLEYILIVIIVYGLMLIGCQILLGPLKL